MSTTGNDSPARAYGSLLAEIASSLDALFPQEDLITKIERGDERVVSAVKHADSTLD
jgi:hypothetical protein